MNKKTILHIFLRSIFLVTFNIIFFMLGGTKHPASVWISYGFIHGTYLLGIISPLLTRKGESTYLFGLTMYTISAIYFLLELIVGVIFILIHSKSYEVALIVQLILASIYLIIFFGNWIANENTADKESEHKKEIAYIKDLSSKIKILIGKSKYKTVNKQLEKLYDLLHSSPTNSNNDVNLLELEIENKINCLEMALGVKSDEEIINIISEIIHCLEERNRQLKLYN